MTKSTVRNSTKKGGQTKNARQSKGFRAARFQNQRETAEDYTELISQLTAEGGEARIGQIAQRLGISHVTAVRTIKRLERDGYVVRSRHRPIQLTPKGAALATASKRRHEIVHAFLRALGVPEDVAVSDSEGIEHHISAVTLGKIEEFLKQR